MYRPAVRRALASIMLVALVVLGTVSCSGTGTGGTGGTGNAEQRAAPWPQRPVVELSFDVADDLASANGRETVLFTPDLQVCELVFRAWPNKPTAAEDGSSLVVTEATVGGAPVRASVESGGAPEGAPGTLVTLPLPQCVAAGTEIRAELGFALRLGEDSTERLGHSPSARMAWFATAFPLLAWVRGEGWARDPAVDLEGETVTSEDFRLAALAVTAPDRYRVLGSGAPAGSQPGPAAGRTTHRFTAEALRDVAVTVGDLQVLERSMGATRLHVGVPTGGTRVDAAGWADALADMTGRLETFLGPYPYPDMWATVVPTLGDGVEFPSAMLYGDVDRGTVPGLVAHEVAHMWFYGLVGNNQATDPWIDESFATYAQARAAGQEDYYDLSEVGDRVRGDLGRPMSFWAERGGFGRYVRGVYDQGAAVLLEGRRRAGEERFDAAMTAYLDANAHQVASPADVAAAFRDVPEVVDLLREHGALPAGS